MWTDGSCLGKLGGYAGGWAARIVRPDGWYADISGAEEPTSNNRMEVRPILEALKLFPDGAEVTVISDSGYAVFPWSKDWISDWIRKGWRNSSGPVSNLDLWQELLPHVERLRVTWVHIRGHGRDGHEWPHNVAMDELAGLRARQNAPASYHAAKARRASRDRFSA